MCPFAKWGLVRLALERITGKVWRWQRGDLSTSNSSARETSLKGLQNQSVCFSPVIKGGKNTSCGHMCNDGLIHVRLNLRKLFSFAAQVCSAFGAGMDSCWRKCGKKVETCAIGAHRCPFCGAGPQAKTTPAPEGNTTCAARNLCQTTKPADQSAATGGGPGIFPWQHLRSSRNRGGSWTLKHNPARGPGDQGKTNEKTNNCKSI